MLTGSFLVRREERFRRAAELLTGERSWGRLPRDEGGTAGLMVVGSSLLMFPVFKLEL